MTEIQKALSRIGKNAPMPLNGCMCQGGECESCNAVVEAFEAMREALRIVVSAGGHLQAGERSGVAMGGISQATDQARAALALADKVSK